MPAPIQRTWSSPEPPSAVLSRLRSHTAPLETGFKLMHRLSGAGVVVRTLEAPKTSLHFFGKVRESDFSIAVVPRATDVTPFHPIVRGTIRESPTGGSTITAELSHHPNARTYAPVYAFGALILALGSILGADGQPALLLGGLMMASLFAAFPTLQARTRFRQAAGQAEATIAKHLHLATSS